VEPLDFAKVDTGKPVRGVLLDRIQQLRKALAGFSKFLSSYCEPGYSIGKPEERFQHELDRVVDGNHSKTAILVAVDLQ
jgi:hypothetical protein